MVYNTTNHAQNDQQPTPQQNKRSGASGQESQRTESTLSTDNQKVIRSVAIDALELFPYQLEGARWLTRHPFRYLADDMGLGKSAQAIKAIQALNLKVVVIICPAIAKYNWENELRKFDPKNTAPIHIISKIEQIKPLMNDLRHLSYLKEKEENKRNPAFGARIILSYAMAPVFLQESCKKLFYFDLLICDEAHFLKNPTSVRAKTVFAPEALASRADRLWLLSGTPAPNHPAELWVMLYTMKIIPLTYDEFVEYFCTYYNFRERKVITGAKRDKIPELRQFLKLFMLRRKKEDVLKELPDLIMQTITLAPGEFELDTSNSFISYVFPKDLTHILNEKLERESKLITSIIKDFAPTMGFQTESMMPLLEGLANSVSTLRRYNGMKKIAPIAQMIQEELRNKKYKKLVVFAIHGEVIDRLGDLLREHYGAMTLYGGTPAEKREKHLRLFEHDPSRRVLIANIHAAGTAINLTNCSNIIMAESAWTPADNAQAIARCHRMGQKEKVLVRWVTLQDDPIDKKVTDIIKRKTKYILEVFDGQKANAPDMYEAEEEFQSVGEENKIINNNKDLENKSPELTIEELLS